MRAIQIPLLVVLTTPGCSTLTSRFDPVGDTDPRGGTGVDDSDGDDTQDTFGGPDIGDTALTGGGDSGTSDLCGNGDIDPGEFCEDTDLQGESCETVGFAAGTLSCDSNCRLDTTACLETLPGGTFCDATQLNISTSSGATVQGFVTIPDAATVDEVHVSIQGYHDWIGDLDFYVSHGGVEVLLASPSSASGNCDSYGVIDVSFDDDAITDPAACDGNNDYLGVRVPLNPLSTFDGQDMAGTWTLRVYDAAYLDGGAITNWCVTINPTP